MLKKMLIITSIMCVVLISTFLLLNQLNIGFTLGQEQEESPLTYSFDNEDYLYYLDEDGIRSAIKKGVASLDTIENFLLPVRQEEGDLADDVILAYIESPYLSILNKARETYDQFNRVISISEASNDLMDEFLPFIVRFRNNQGYVYTISFEEGEEAVQPVYEETRGNGSEKVAYFRVSDLPLDAGGNLKVSDPLNANRHLRFKVNFADYVHP
ncbi:hypothetical protein SAMN05421736_109102 [Evansella caseinilytica]|uniref:Uncharacterized protein n=1 Tax=Evansella caseinilytica TaxID=1503961 RepID=A0A1H3RWS9_9BACI|nr:hypothetical protein [Evansella caseinilytica]SDZ30122.1 hypothetical protein SAMN05421736_109102 [Evansella caseinilytica]